MEVSVIHNECIIELREELIHLRIVQETACIAEIELKYFTIHSV